MQLKQRSTRHTHTLRTTPTNLAHDLNPGEPIHVDKCDDGTDCDVDAPMTNVEASFTCENFSANILTTPPKEEHLSLSRARLMSNNKQMNSASMTLILLAPTVITSKQLNQTQPRINSLDRSIVSEHQYGLA